MVKEKTKSGLIGLIALIALVALIWCLLWYLFQNYWGPDTLSEKGMFGDSFGTINSLFSALAFAGIIYTIILQSRELRLQREELEETRKTLNRTADAQAESEIQLRRQSNNLKKSAELNALNSLLIYEMDRAKTHIQKIKQDAIKKQAQYVQKIEQILNEKQDSF